MKIAGFVAEFNPFHRGHEYLINFIKRDSNPDLIVVAMSPNFVMRGEPAVFDKMERTKIAINYGVDLVLQIPTVYTIQAADVYAKKGVEILNAAGITDLYFGVENEEEHLFKTIVEAMDSKDYKKYLQAYLDQGNSFNSASKKALTTINPDFERIVSSPNNLLAIQYLIAIREINPTIVTHFVKRVDTGYFDQEKRGKEIQSASALRDLLLKGKGKKYFSYSIKGLNQHVKNDYFELIKYQIVSQTETDLTNILGINDGFEHKLKGIEKWTNYDGLVKDLVSKRDRETKINRILMALLLNIKKIESTKTPITFVRVLGFNERGQNYLKQERNSNILFVSSIKRGLPDQIYRELNFTKIYGLPYEETELSKDEYAPIIKGREE